MSGIFGGGALSVGGLIPGLSVGDLLVGAAAGILAVIPAVAVGSVLVSQGVGVAPAYSDRIKAQGAPGGSGPALWSNANVGTNAGRIFTDDATGSFIGYGADASAHFNVSHAFLSFGGTEIDVSSGQIAHTATKTTISGNLIVGATDAGTTAARVLALHNSATSPTTFVDLAQIYGKDISAGNATLALLTEREAQAGVAVQTGYLEIFVNLGGVPTLKKFLYAD